MSNYLVKVDTSGETPKATVEKRTTVQAIGDSITTMVKDDEASVGYVKTGVTLGLVYAGALFARYRASGTLSYNPWSA